MIRQHEFNSEWWGDEVGIVTDSAILCTVSPKPSSPPFNNSLG